MSESQPFTLRDGIAFQIDPYARYGFEFFRFRSPPMVTEMDTFISQTKACRCLLDIGAFHGMFSLAFCAIDSTRVAHAFEPSLKAYPVLLENIALNPSFNITPHPNALSAKTGTIYMGYEWDHAVVKPTFFDVNTDIVAAEGTTVDAFCLEHALRPDVIKIDVEGHEIKVLRGMIDTMKQHRPIVFLELRVEGLALEGDTYEDMVTIADDVGYTVADSERHCVLRPRL